MKTQLNSDSLMILGKLALIQALADKAQVEVDQLTFCCHEFSDEEVKCKLNKITEIYNGVFNLISDAMKEASNVYLETKTRK